MDDLLHAARDPCLTPSQGTMSVSQNFGFPNLRLKSSHRQSEYDSRFGCKDMGVPDCTAFTPSPRIATLRSTSTFASVATTSALSLKIQPACNHTS